MSTPITFEEAGFTRHHLRTYENPPAAPGIVILIANAGGIDGCLAGFASDNIAADLHRRMIFRATEIAVLTEEPAETPEERVAQATARMLKAAALIKKYGIPPENIVPPGV